MSLIAATKSMYPNSFSRNRTFKPKWRGSGNHNRSFTRNKSAAIPSAQYINRAVVQETSSAYTAIHQFQDFQINQQLKANIENRGYVSPTPIQDQAIEPILIGKDVVGIANTGTGKTAAFLIPLINKIVSDRTQRVLIMVPTRELAMQIKDESVQLAKDLHITAQILIGGANLQRQIFALKQNPNLVIATPGRLKDLIKRRSLVLSQFRTIVLDEVDRMVDIGFITDIKFIISHLSQLRQSLFFSATVSPQINTIIQSFLKNPITISVKSSETAQSIEQDIIRVKDKAEKLTKLHALLRQEEFKKVLIFGATKWNVEKLAKTLAQSGFSVASIHGNKSQGQRLRALSQFKQNQLQVLVATDIAARGLDIVDVSHVINFDEPHSYTDYVHRIGRTGRANKAGKALTFVI